MMLTVSAAVATGAAGKIGRSARSDLGGTTAANLKRGHAATQRGITYAGLSCRVALAGLLA